MGYHISVSEETIATARTCLSALSRPPQEHGQGPDIPSTREVTARTLQRLERGNYPKHTLALTDVTKVREMIAGTQGEHGNAFISSSAADRALTELWQTQQALMSDPSRFETAGVDVTR